MEMQMAAGPHFEHPCSGRSHPVRAADVFLRDNLRFYTLSDPPASSPPLSSFHNLYNRRLWWIFQDQETSWRQPGWRSRECITHPTMFQHQWLLSMCKRATAALILYISFANSIIHSGGYVADRRIQGSNLGFGVLLYRQPQTSASVVDREFSDLNAATSLLWIVFSVVCESGQTDDSEGRGSPWALSAL